MIMKITKERLERWEDSWQDARIAPTTFPEYLAERFNGVLEQIESVLSDWEMEMEESGVGIRGENERRLIRAIREAMDTL